eukprot:3818386-Rhodomonas_salina.4
MGVGEPYYAVCNRAHFSRSTIKILRVSPCRPSLVSSIRESKEVSSPDLLPAQPVRSAKVFAHQRRDV